MGDVTGEPPKTLIAPLGGETLTSRVRDRLRTLMKRGAFRPGEALTIRNLAASFGVSPTPVREALQQLVAEGAILATANRSFRIGEMTRERFLDIREVRLNLEGLAAERAAIRITPAELGELKRLNAEMERAIGKDLAGEYLPNNEAFHFVIYRAAASPTLLQIIDGLWMRIGPYLNDLFAGAPLEPCLTDHHVELIDALSAGDGAAAAAAIRRDILSSDAKLGRVSWG